MKHKTAELSGALLDAAVAVAEGWIANPGGGWHVPTTIEIVGQASRHGLRWESSAVAYSTEWQHGGPIIERERVQLLCVAEDDFEAKVGAALGNGPTPLVAAMRAYCAAKLGDEVDLP